MSPNNKKKLNLIRIKLDKLDNKLLYLIKIRSNLVKEVLKVKETKSEIVVPMYKGEILIGQLDIDSHKTNPFTSEDHELLNFVVEFVAERLD